MGAGQGRSLFLYVALQRLDVFGEGVASGVGDAAHRAGNLAPEGLFDLDVTRFGEFVQLHREVSRRGSGLLPDEDEVGAFDPDEDRNDGQSQFGVQQGIQLFEHRVIGQGGSTCS